MKLTKNLRDRCVSHIRRLASQMVALGIDNDADYLAACEVEEEPVQEPVRLCEAWDALRNAGWTQSERTIDKSRKDVEDVIPYEWVRADRRCLVAVGNKPICKCDSIDGWPVVWTRYCPPDLLDGRLAALGEEAKP